MTKLKSLKLGIMLIFLGIPLGVIACQSGTSGLLSNTTPISNPPNRTATDLPPKATHTATLAAPQTITAESIPPSTTPTPTQTVLPTATATTRGALSWEQERRLYDASQQFLAKDEDEAIAVSRDQIDYLVSEAEHPSLVCGPLSAVILRDAGLLPPDVDLHGFWLLDPDLIPSQRILETYFPSDRYEWHQFDESTTAFDFNAFPLLPGDFLYLYAGINGTFEHMITVNRVDEAGRAYTVSNMETDDGFVIRELMLYDPNGTGVGQFYDWMNREINGLLGMTGDGGFDLWRPIAPVKDYPTP